MDTLARTIATHARSRGGDVAFRDGRRTVSWADYDCESDALAARLLDLGIAPGTRVAVLLPDGADPHVAYVACEKVGAVTVGIGPRAGRGEIAHLLGKTGADVLITRSRHRDEPARALVDTLRTDGVTLRHHLEAEDGFGPGARWTVDSAMTTATAATDAHRQAMEQRRLGLDDLWLLNSTSGTTGLPKCVTHHQARWYFFHELACRTGELTESDVFMSVVPTPFGFGLWTAHFTPTLLGAPVSLVERFDATEMIERIETERVTVLAAVTTQFIMMLNDPALERHDVSSLRALYTGGELVPQARAREFENRTGAKVLQFYGSNETGVLSGTTTRDPQDKRLGTSGKVVAEMNVRLFDDGGNDVTSSGRGQPGCKGPAVSHGYYRDDAANAELIRPDGWVMIGDIVSIDPDGYLTVEGRVADFIIRGGKNISGKVVEESVETHPRVSRAAAVPMPDPVFGERVCVYVELSDDGTLTLEELTSFLSENQTSKEYLPERLVVLPELPQSSGGKIAKGELKKDAAKRAG